MAPGLFEGAFRGLDGVVDVLLAGVRNFGPYIAGKRIVGRKHAPLGGRDASTIDEQAITLHVRGLRLV
jgi:hypothetical protein